MLNKEKMRVILFFLSWTKDKKNTLIILAEILSSVFCLQKSTFLDYSRVEIAVAARPQPMKL
jgi:hypothetical protein